MVQGTIPAGWNHTTKHNRIITSLIVTKIVHNRMSCNGGIWRRVVGLYHNVKDKLSVVCCALVQVSFIKAALLEHLLWRSYPLLPEAFCTVPYQDLLSFSFQAQSSHPQTMAASQQLGFTIVIE